MTEQIKLNLYQKLAKIRSEISIKKTGSASKYDYYQIDEIYAQAKKLFGKHNIFTMNRLIFIGEYNIYRAILTVIDADFPDEQIEFMMDSPMNQGHGTSACQNIGANNTYQFKYCWMNLLLTDDGAHDPDAKKSESNNYQKQEKKEQPVTWTLEETKEHFKAITDIKNCESVEELKEIWDKLSPKLQAALADLKDEKKFIFTYQS